MQPCNDQTDGEHEAHQLTNNPNHKNLHEVPAYIILIKVMKHMQPTRI